VPVDRHAFLWNSAPQVCRAKGGRKIEATLGLRPPSPPSKQRPGGPSASAASDRGWPWQFTGANIGERFVRPSAGGHSMGSFCYCLCTNSETKNLRGWRCRQRLPRVATLGHPDAAVRHPTTKSASERTSMDNIDSFSLSHMTTWD